MSVEVALSLVLLIGAGLMVRSLWNLQNTDPGFDATQCADDGLERSAAAIHRIGGGNAISSTRCFNRVRALPGVDSAAAIDDLPLRADPTSRLR